MVDAGGEDSRGHVVHDQEARDGLGPTAPPSTDLQAHTKGCNLREPSLAQESCSAGSSPLRGPGRGSE